MFEMALLKRGMTRAYFGDGHQVTTMAINNGLVPRVIECPVCKGHYLHMKSASDRELDKVQYVWWRPATIPDQMQDRFVAYTLAGGLMLGDLERRDLIFPRTMTSDFEFSVEHDGYCRGWPDDVTQASLSEAYDAGCSRVASAIFAMINQQGMYACEPTWVLHPIRVSPEQSIQHIEDGSADTMESTEHVDVPARSNELVCERNRSIDEPAPPPADEDDL